MTYTEYKNYIKNKYSLAQADADFLFAGCETVYLNYTSPFDLSKAFDDTNSRAINWVTRAVQSILDKGDLNVTEYSENGLKIVVDITLINELVPTVGVVKANDDVE